MDFEAPADAWYVYVAVVIISATFAGIAVGIPSAPPPDATQTANTIEGVTASEFAGSASYEHDADIVRIDHQTITMKNDHGESHASFSYGTVVPVNGDDRLENIVNGQSFEDAFEEELADPNTDGSGTFFGKVASADEENTGEDLYAKGELVARTIAIEEDSAVGIEARAETNDALAKNLTETDDDLEKEDVEVVGEIRLREVGNVSSETELEFEGTPVVETIDVDESSGWLTDRVTGFTCSIADIWCDDDPDIEPIHDEQVTLEGLEGSERITLSDTTLEEATDTEDEPVELWTGSYELEVTARGDDFEDCRGTIETSEEWTTVCGPDLTLEEFDDPHWHDDNRGVHYVTLVVV